MHIALLNVVIVIEKNEAVTDKYSNHKNTWSDYFRCHATAGGESGTEKDAAGQTVESADVTFTVRWCKKIDSVTSTGFRIRIGETEYNILSIDHQNYKRRSVKFRCKKVER